jgi:hypothetical protein
MAMGEILMLQSFLKKFNDAKGKGSLPDFLGIGTQKSGTVWLYRNLCEHPKIFIPREKDLNFFSDEFQMYDGVEKRYLHYFRGAEEKVKGEIATHYCLLPKHRIQFIKKLMPKAKIILLLRNPVERSWSGVYHEFCRLQKRKLEDVSESEILDYFQTTGKGFASYSDMLDRWQSVYPASQMFVGLFDQITNQPKEMLQDIFRFLGVSEDVDWNTIPYKKVFNRGSSEKIPEQYKAVLVNMYRDEIKRLQELGAPVAAWEKNF